MYCEIFIGVVVNFFMVSSQFAAQNNELQDGEDYGFYSSKYQNSANSLAETIPGEAESDYPTYTSVPRTTFSCKGRVNWGYYADIETECQAFHVCEAANSKISFLCPIGSAFNQRLLTCDWWYNFNCRDAVSLAEGTQDQQIDLNLASSGDIQRE